MRIKKVCCSNCFCWESLQKRVRSRARRTGSCSYCGTTNTKVIAVGSLTDSFRNWLLVYKLDPGSGIAANYETLIEKAQEHWKIFNENLDPNTQSALLEDILNSGRSDTTMPISSEDYYRLRAPDEVEQWHRFCAAVRQEYSGDGLAGAGVTIDAMIRQAGTSMGAGAVLYRARLGSASAWAPYAKEQMGAPPVNKARAARANFAEQRVLYCADADMVAVSEVRPARGMLVSVCKMAMHNTVRVLDLVDLPQRVNPFTQELRVHNLLHRFAREMSKPLRYHEDDSQYLETQRLCELVSRAGIGGIRYPSALCAKGANLVFFDTTVVEILESRLVEVMEVVVEIQELSGELNARGAAEEEAGR